MDPTELRRQTEAAISRLTPREQLVLRLRFGLGEFDTHKYNQIAEQLGISSQTVRRIETGAFRKLRSPTLRHEEEKQGVAAGTENTDAIKSVLYPALQAQDVMEGVRALSPELIEYLKLHASELDKLPWEVFEHLVGEFLAAHGFEDVRLVGRDPSTSADIYAAKLVPPLANGLRLFVEVKRWNNGVGIEAINEVLGALISERPRYGWNAAMVVAKCGFRNFRKFTLPELSLMNLELREKADLLKWLQNYSPNKNGLWLPSPERTMRGLR
jgi:DNA-binding CsgD family transcriptional regulator